MSRRNIVIVVLSIFILIFLFSVLSKSKIVNAPEQNIEQITSVSESTPNSINTPTISSENNINIAVNYPAPNSIVKRTFVVHGQVRVFENQFNIRVKNAAGNIIFEKSALANVPNSKNYGIFNEQITLSQSVQSGEKIILEVFDYSAKDGSEIDKITIPLKFIP